MNAMKMAFFVSAFVIASGILAGSGIFDTSWMYQPDVTMPSADLADGIMEVEPGTSSTDDLESAFNAWEMISNVFSAVKTLFMVLVLPYSYLVSFGVPKVFALGIQSMVTLSEILGAIQILRNMNIKV